jgi:hypothetical protein
MEEEEVKPKRKMTESQLSNLRPIQKGECRNPNGRPKSMIKRVIEEVETTLDVKITKRDVGAIFTYLNSLPLHEIKRISLDTEVPGFISVVANAILGDISNKEMKNSQWMMEFQFGKSNQAIEVLHKEDKNSINPKIMSDDEIRARLSEIRNRDITEGTFEEII